MGEWMEAYLDSKDSETNSPGGQREDSPKVCPGFADKQGRCTNITDPNGSVFCDECRAYRKSGEWRGR